MNNQSQETVEGAKQMFLSGVERVFSSLEEGEKFGSKEEFAKRLWNDSNVQYALTTYAQTIRDEERDRIIQIANKEAVSVDDCKNIVVIPKHKLFIAITPTTNHTGDANP